MHQLKRKTELNSLVCSGTYANEVMALTLPNNLDVTIYGFLLAFQVKEKTTDQLLGRTKKLRHGSNRIFKQFPNKHLMGFLSSCLAMIY